MERPIEEEIFRWVNMNRGPSFFFAAAGFTSTGVFQAALQLSNLAIGVVSTQNHLHPGTILTSMLKRVDITVYTSFSEAKFSTWNSGVQFLRLEENGLGWALYEHKRNLVRPEVSKTRTDREGHNQGKISRQRVSGIWFLGLNDTEILCISSCRPFEWSCNI